MKGVTPQLLWEEYKQHNTEGYSCNYNLWQKKLNPTMRFNHKAGEKMFVDFSGNKPAIVDHETGEKAEVEIFVYMIVAGPLHYSIRFV